MNRRIEGRTVLILGGTGQVGQAVVRVLLPRKPRKVVITGLTEREVNDALQVLRPEADRWQVPLVGDWGNIFVRTELKDVSLRMLFDRIEHRPEEVDEDAWNMAFQVVEDILEELTADRLHASFLYHLMDRHRPEIVVDTINTATAVAYQDVYAVARAAFQALRSGNEAHAPRGFVRLLATLSVPQLIRHVQILWESLIHARTEVYVKVGTTGTGGMGLNIPYTHGEERPSRVLLSKSALAGAHTLLLLLASRTPGISLLKERFSSDTMADRLHTSRLPSGPIIKEIKPAALIAWKRLKVDRVHRRGRPLPLFDVSRNQVVRLKPGETFDLQKIPPARPVAEAFESLYVDTGENGLFSLEEYKAITLLHQMEFVTPEEIAQVVLWEIEGRNTSRDVIAALDAAVMGPTYRAGVLRDEVLLWAERQPIPDREVFLPSIAFEILGPPRLSKLLLEAAILKAAVHTLDRLVTTDTETLVRKVEQQVWENPGFRRLGVSIGIPILLPDGQNLLCVNRGVREKDWEKETWQITPETVDRMAQWEWVDLRPSNLLAWQDRARVLLAVLQSAHPEEGSPAVEDLPPGRWPRTPEGAWVLDPGYTVGWLFSREDQGRRMNR